MESLNCPHVITGSSKSLMLYDILRTGPLYGRFFLKYIEGMDEYFAKDLVYKWCEYYGIRTLEHTAAWTAWKSAGNPYYIQLIVKQAVEMGLHLDSLENLIDVYVASLTYGRKAKQFDQFKGIAVQIYILYMMSKWDNREVDGNRYFGTDRKIVLPKFRWVDNKKLKPESEKEVEIDILGVDVGVEVQWLGECKYRNDKVGLGVVKEFAEKRAETGRKVYNRETTVLWFFSRKGFSENAEKYMKERGILHTNEEELNSLLESFGVSRLPKEL